MNIMPCRLIHLMLCFIGYQKTGISLVEFHESKFSHFFAADDIGIYVLIPKIAFLLNINIFQAINLFFYGSLLCAWTISFLGFFLIYKKTLSRIIIFIATLLLIIFSLRIGDTYLFYLIPTIITVPWTLYFYKKSFTKKSLLFYTGIGIIMGLSHAIRSYTLLPPLFFTFSLIISKQEKFFFKTLRSLFLVYGLLIPMFYFHYTFQHYLTYVHDHNLSNPSKTIKNHLVWHSVYASFGFLSFKNPDNIEWSDASATKKAQSINPKVTYNTPEYEKVLKQEVINLIKNHRVFVIMTIFAKIGILLLYLIIFANLGLIAAFLKPQNWPIEIAFWGSLALSSLFPLISLPTPEYSLAFITIAALYGITSINNLLESKYAWF